jgi:hypothetical protein
MIKRLLLFLLFTVSLFAQIQIQSLPTYVDPIGNGDYFIIQQDIGGSWKTKKVRYDSLSSNLFGGVMSDSLVVLIYGDQTIYGQKKYIQDILLKQDDASLRSELFSSGWTGDGFLLGYRNRWNNKFVNFKNSYLEVDELSVRKKLSAYEMEINKVSASNGDLFITNSGIVDSVEYIGTRSIKSDDGYILFTSDNSLMQQYQLTVRVWFNDASGINIVPFRVNDIITMQENYPTSEGSSRFTIDYCVGTVRRVDSKSVTMLIIAGDKEAIKEGQSWVRIGNTSNLNRQGSIYLSVNESYSPFIRVIDDVNSLVGFSHPDSMQTLKVQMGRVDGIKDPDFALLNGNSSQPIYGFYAAEGTVFINQGYFKDGILVGTGKTIEEALAEKPDSTSFGAAAWKDKIEASLLGTTVISGGYISTSLISTADIIARVATIDSLAALKSNLGTVTNIRMSGNAYFSSLISTRSDNTYANLSNNNISLTWNDLMNPSKSISMAMSSNGYPTFSMTGSDGGSISMGVGEAGEGFITADKLNANNGADGSFTTVDSKTVTVSNGIITAITP